MNDQSDVDSMSDEREQMERCMHTNQPIEFHFRGRVFEVVEEIMPGLAAVRTKFFLVTDTANKVTWCVEGLKVGKVIYRDESINKDETRLTTRINTIVARDVQEFFVELIDEFCDLHDV